MRRRDLAVWPDQEAAASAPGAPCLGASSLVCDTLQLTYCTKLFHQTVHALCFERHIVQDEALYKCRLLFEDPTLEAEPRRMVPKGCLSLGGILGGQSHPLMGKSVGKVARGARAAQIPPPKKQKTRSTWHRSCGTSGVHVTPEG